MKYPVTGAPPFELGASHLRVTLEPLALAVRLRGADGTVAGVAESTFDAAPVPAELLARTLNEYLVPLTRPPIEQPRLVVVHVAPPGDALAVYDVIGAPPSEVGAVHERATRPSPGVAEARVGAPGTLGL